MITGYVIKRSDTDFVVNCDSHGIGGYNVVPKEIAKDCEYTLEEVRTYLLDNPEMLIDMQVIEMQRLTREARARRDALLKETVDSVNPMRWEALTDEQKDAWRVYRQALLDVPQQEGFPMNIVWPTIPTNNNTAQEVQT